MSKNKSKTKDELSIEDIIKLGINAGIEYIQKQEEIRTGQKNDRRLRNTKLLLKIYRSLKKHVEISGATLTALDAYGLADILDTLDYDLSEEKLVHSIFRSKERTALLLKHVDTCLDYLKWYSKSIGRPVMYNIIYEMYIAENDDNRVLNQEEVCEKLHISQSTLSRNLNAAILELSILNFGIDSIRI